MLPSHLSLENTLQNIAVPNLYHNTPKQDIFSEIIYKRLSLINKTNL